MTGISSDDQPQEYLYKVPVSGVAGFISFVGWSVGKCTKAGLKALIANSDCNGQGAYCYGKELGEEQ